MNTKVKLALAAGLALSGFGLLASTASALPAQGLNRAIASSAEAQNGVQEAAYICRPWGCHWVPGYGYGYGWHRWGGGWGWHHWHHW